MELPGALESLIRPLGRQWGRARRPRGAQKAQEGYLLALLSLPGPFSLFPWTLRSLIRPLRALTRSLGAL